MDTREASIKWLETLSHEQAIRRKLEWQAANGPYPAAGEISDWEPQFGITPSKEQLREWWSAVEAVWREYSRQTAAGFTLNPPPAELAGIMGNLAGYLAVGQLPDPISEATRSEGRTAPGPDERRDIGIAVAYHRAATEGLLHNGKVVRVEDRTHTKTICGLYDVRDSTVRSWMQKHQPAFLGINDITPSLLKARLVQAAKRYRNGGRSKAAIEQRCAKR